MNRLGILVIALVGCATDGSDRDNPTHGDVDAGPIAPDAAPPPTQVIYEVTFTGGACDVLANPLVHPLQAGFAMTDYIQLPFAFPFYEGTVARLSVHERGLIYLYTPTSTEWEYSPPREIPTAAAPNAIIAPFWTDNLFDGGTPGLVASRGKVRTAVVDDHFTIEWNDFYLSSTGVTDAQSHATIQAKLFPDGAIEMRYCTLTTAANEAPGEHTGGSASIGIESQSGQQGLRFAFKEAGAVSTDRGLRFTRR